jgi:integrase
VAIPLFPQAIEIIKRYNECILPDAEDKVFPTVAIQSMNAYLKEVAELCGIDKNLTTHVGRRTAASTILLASGVPIETISKILSHKNIRTTQIYARVQDHHVKNDIEKIIPLLAKRYPLSDT